MLPCQRTIRVIEGGTWSTHNYDEILSLYEGSRSSS